MDKKTRPGIIAVIIAALVAAPAAAAVFATLYFGAGDQICKGVKIEDIEVGGLNRREAGDLLQPWAVKQAGRRIVLTALDSRWVGKATDFGARHEWRNAVDMAYAVGREGDIIRRAVCVLTNGGIGKQIGVPVVVDESRVTKTIDKVAKAVNRPHKNASLKTVGGRLEIVDDSCGIKLDEKRAVDSVVGALKSNQLVVQLPVEADRPDVTADDLREIDTLLARFSTRFNPGKRDRTHNLVLAARSMDGIVVKPGREFSYNDTVGPRVLTRGFREAPIFVRGKMEPGVGGGICQVSSTLYNAVLLAGLKVVERAPHSRTVPYVSAGRDATVAYGLRDFRFENVGSAAVGILTHINGSQLTVDIYGSARDKKNISVFTGPVAYHGGAGEKTVIDTGLAPGARKVIDKGSKGASVTVYRKVTDSDGKVVTEVVSRDRYPKQDTIVAVGPKIQPVQAELSVTPASVAGAGGNDVRAE